MRKILLRPNPPPNRVEYIGFFTIRWFNTTDEYFAWKALPWYKRIFKY